MILSILTLFSGCLMTLLVINNLPYTVNMYDLGHTFLPCVDRKKYGWINETLILSQLLFTTTIPWDELMNCVFLMGIFYWVRCLTIPLTIVPSIKLSTEKIKYYGLFGGINDLLPFSGHTGLVVISMCYIGKTYGLFIGLSFFLYSFLISIFIIVLRNHYTVEVVLSWLFCPLLYSFYERHNVRL